jgi:hypothetical protein
MSERKYCKYCDTFFDTNDKRYIETPDFSGCVDCYDKRNALSAERKRRS